MKVEIYQHIEKALVEYTTGPHFATLLEAKENFFQLTGRLTEADDEFEPRMSFFNDWYLFDFISRRNTTTVIKDYLAKHQIPDDTAVTLLSVNYSLFVFEKISFRGHIVLKDIIHNTKVTLSKDHPHVALIEGDIFVGRVLTQKNDGQAHLLKGLVIFPSDIKKALMKQAAKITKMKDPFQEAEFLLQLIFLKTKWVRYGHIDISKIFIFDSHASSPIPSHVVK